MIAGPKHFKGVGKTSNSFIAKFHGEISITGYYSVCCLVMDQDFMKND